MLELAANSLENPPDGTHTRKCSWEEFGRSRCQLRVGAEREPSKANLLSTLGPGGARTQVQVWTFREAVRHTVAEGGQDSWSCVDSRNHTVICQSRFLQCMAS